MLCALLCAYSFLAAVNATALAEPTDPATQPPSPAAQIIIQLGQAVTHDYNATSDPEGLLGLPGQYLAKATFADGSVETFSTTRRW